MPAVFLSETEVLWNWCDQLPFDLPRMITRSLPKTFSSTCRRVGVREGASRTCISYKEWGSNKVKSGSNKTYPFKYDKAQA